MQVNVRDLMQIMQGVSGRTELNQVQQGFADVDMNQKVNIQDLMREMKYVSGQTDSLI
jgi:hypothetical protein